MRHTTLLILSLVACAGEDPVETGTEETGTEETGGGVEDIAIAGEWVDSYGSSHIITNLSWDSYGADTPVTLTAYDNTEMWAVGQNSANDEYNPELWSRFDWHYDSSDQLWYCQTAFGAASEQEAIDTPPADSSDPANGGCSTFTWSALTPAE